jgi:hypothetical protein
LGEHASLETARLTADGHQLIAQMAAGQLRIDGTMSVLTCTGPGVSPDPAVAGAEVTIVAGRTTSVVCQESQPSH